MEHARIPREEISMAVEAVAKTKFPADVRRMLAKALLETECAVCRTRIPIDERTMRKVNGTHWIFHRRCADRGVLEKRYEAAKSRAPQPRMSVQAARRLVDAAKRRY